MPAKEKIDAIEMDKIEMDAPQVDAKPGPWEKRFVRGNGYTIYLVLDGKRLAFSTWDAMASNFGAVPQYDESHGAGVVVIPHAELDAIPDGGLYE